MSGVESLSRELGGILSPDYLDELAFSSRGVRIPVPVAGFPLLAFDGQLISESELGAGERDRLMGMAGFTTYDDIVNALSVNARGQYVDWNKASLGATVAATSWDIWQATGTPPAGTFGVSGTGRVIDRTFAAALPFTNAGGGRFMHALTVGAGSTVTLGTLLLYDRLAEYPFTGTATSASWGTVPTLPSRDANGVGNGDGVMMMLETFSATTRAAVTVTPTYTNSAGTGSKTNAFTSVAGTNVAGQLSNPTGSVFAIPLASGDVGVRSMQSYTLSASLLAANMNFTLYRPLAYVPILAPNSYVERDLVLQMANLPRLYDGSALAFMLLANTTTSPVFGRCVWAEN